MKVYEAIMNRRTIRKFEQKPIEHDALVKLVDCARMAAYAANMQPLKFKIVDDKESLNKIFPYTKWAAMLKDGTPSEDERPVAYIALLGDTSIKKSFECDAGAAATTIMLAAYEMGIASCQLGAINRDGIKKALDIDDKYELPYIIALGYPSQKSKAVEAKDGSIKYFMDENNVLNIPKRPLDEVLI